MPVIPSGARDLDATDDRDPSPLAQDDTGFFRVHPRDPRPQMTALLSVQNLNAWYGRAHILFDVALEVAPGEVVALMGRNGAGKSTTLKAIMGLVSQRSGSVRFDGRPIEALEPFEISRAGVGFVPEDRRIF